MAKKKKRDIVAEAKRIAAENLEYQQRTFPGRIEKGRQEQYYAPAPERRPPKMRQRMAREEAARRRVEARLEKTAPKAKPKKQGYAQAAMDLLGEAKRIFTPSSKERLEGVAGNVGKYRRGAN